MSIGKTIGSSYAAKRHRERHWHQVPAGRIFGTICWFKDGWRRRVRNEQVWRCGYYAFGGFEDGPQWTYVYAYDRDAWPIAFQNCYSLDDYESRYPIKDRSPITQINK